MATTSDEVHACWEWVAAVFHGVPRVLTVPPRSAPSPLRNGLNTQLIVFFFFFERQDSFNQ
ncbi:hypothetical protein HanIR_Chr02g0094781 [Helianthus annuus]|nr:hypothetical protein HanIR_Chr02g0094781 [Helianthus annuus]